ncbi:MAG TPA: hypothetical protein PKE69_25820, partial [Pyrinomonadaceae bacterium]|nr:hypothetical protein [Pyrinomonadaceae bacterium]
LLCKNCQKARNYWLITPMNRQIFMSAQKLSPLKFVEFARQKSESVREVSVALKKIISQILGKELVSDRFLLAAQN